MYLLPRASPRRASSPSREKFNKKDHTTVIAAVERIRMLRETDASVSQALQSLTAKLTP